MKIIIVGNTKKNLQDVLIDDLRKTKSIYEVAKIMQHFRYRYVFLEVINALINMLTELEEKNKKLERKLREGIELL